MFLQNGFLDQLLAVLQTREVKFDKCTDFISL
jgi:hypothetical protein